MRPESLVPSRARVALRDLQGSDPSAARLRRLDGALFKACRVWGLEPLAPVTHAARSVVWVVQHTASGRPAVLKVPLHREAAVVSAHHELDRLRCGPPVLEHDTDTGALLLERVVAPSVSRLAAAYGFRGEEAVRFRRRLDRMVLEALAALPSASAVPGSEDFAVAVAARLKRRALQPGRAAECEAAVSRLEELLSDGYVLGVPQRAMASGGVGRFCHGAFSPVSLRAADDRVCVTGPRGVSGDAHADLAGWMLRTATPFNPVRDASERAANAAQDLGWDDERASGWVEVLSAAGLAPSRTHRP